MLVRRFGVTNSTGSLNYSGNVLQITDNPTGTGTVSGSILSGSIDGTTRLDFNPRVIDGATAVGFFMDTKNVLSTTGARLLSLRNSGTEKMYIGFDGNVNSVGTVTGTRLISTIAAGTSPLAVTSNTLVTNLNADLLDGQHGSYYATLVSHLQDSLDRNTDTLAAHNIRINNLKNSMYDSTDNPFTYSSGKTIQRASNSTVVISDSIRIEKSIIAKHLTRQDTANYVLGWNSGTGEVKVMTNNVSRIKRVTTRSYTLSRDDATIIFYGDQDGNQDTVFLPNPANFVGHKFVVQKAYSDACAIIAPSGNLYSRGGFTSGNFNIPAYWNFNMEFQSDGGYWYTIHQDEFDNHP
jgi:hypothetical protein